MYSYNKKLTRKNVKVALNSWRKTFNKLKRKPASVNYNNHTRPGTDYLIADGYTGTSPTVWDCVHESDVDSETETQDPE